MPLYIPVTKESLGLGNVDNTSDANKPISSAQQTALDAKLASTSVLRSYLAATITYNNTDVLADTALSVTVAAGGIYQIELRVYSASAVKTLNMDFGGTATVTNFIGEWAGFGASGTVSEYPLLKVTDAGTDFADSGFDGIDAFYTFAGSVEINGAGTFLLRGAQWGADASNTTILRGSTLILTKLN